MAGFGNRDSSRDIPVRSSRRVQGATSLHDVPPVRRLEPEETRDEPTSQGRFLLERGRVVVIDIDVEKGLEGQPPRRTRMCVVVSDESVNEAIDFPLVAVVPISGTASMGALYPTVAPGKEGILQTSYALVDMVRSIDKRRIRRLLGRLAKNELDAIDRGLELYLGLGGTDVRADKKPGALTAEEV